MNIIKCPDCGTILDHVLDVVQETHKYPVTLDKSGKWDISDTEDSGIEDSDTIAFQCPVCGSKKHLRDEFIAEEKQYKFICPMCKKQINNVKAFVKEYHTYHWIINTWGSPEMSHSEFRDNETVGFDCPECEYEGKTLEEFIVEVEP